MRRRVIVSATAAVVIAVAVAAGWLLRATVGSDAAVSVPTPSTVEIGYLQDMATHHQQAVVMAKAIDREGIDPGVRLLARQISESQQYELGTMIGWLRMSGQPMDNPEPMAWMPDTDHMSAMSNHPGSHHGDAHDMPGMATPEQLGQLGSASGAAAEDLFLELMSRHHQGGIAMARTVLPIVTTAAVRESVLDTINGQSREVGLMESMLEERSSQAPIPG